ncbi:MAG: 30S ribosomal protein S6 [Planctomycetota bacterium]
MTERLYEGLFLVDASVASQNWAELEALMTGIVTNHGGSIEYSEKWPEQRLAYEINGTKRGVYFLVYFRADTQSIVGMRNDAQLSEKIMRCLFVQETFLEEEMKRRQEVAERRAAEPEPAAEETAAEEPVAEEAAAEAPAEEAAADETVADEAAADSGESEAAEEPVAVEHDAGAGEEEEKE